MELPVSSDEQAVQVDSLIANEELLAAKRAVVIEAAMKLMLRQGFYRTTVRDIAVAANMTMGALYQYIRRKEDILYLVAERTMSELSEGLLRVQPGPSSRETLVEALDQFFDACERVHGQILLIYRETKSLPREQQDVLKLSELRERAFLADIVRRGIRDGEFRDVNPEVLAHDIIQLGHMWPLKRWAFNTDFDEFKETQKEFVMRLLLND